MNKVEQSPRLLHLMDFYSCAVVGYSQQIHYKVVTGQQPRCSFAAPHEGFEQEVV